MGYFILSRTRNLLKLSLMPKCLWKTSSISSNEFNTSSIYVIHFPPQLESQVSGKRNFYFILSSATSGSYMFFTYSLASWDFFFMREDKQKILQHISHGKFFKLFLIFFLSHWIQGTHRCHVLYFSASLNQKLILHSKSKIIFYSQLQ